MIKFFKTIRFNLVAKSNTDKATLPTVKYLKYAIGEILLVVIGILIALAINNWNEQQKNKKIELTFLEDFKKDLETDIATLSERIITNTKSIKASDTIFRILSTKTKLGKEATEQFIEYNFNLTGESYFTPEKSTINQLEASSSGRLISSKILKDKLFRYYSFNERAENNLEKSVQLYQHSFITKEILESILGGGSSTILANNNLLRTTIDLNQLRENSTYLFALASKKIGTKTQNDSYIKISATAKEIIDLIDLEYQILKE